MIAICVPSGSTAVEQRSIQESAEAAGARKVFLIEEPIINDKYFDFGNIKTVIKKEHIDFLQEENIRGDLYYEF